MWHWSYVIGSVLALVLVALVGVPYFLPLGGPETTHPAALSDGNGAFVEIDKDTLYYTHAGGSGEPVILLHGFGGSTVTWTDTLPALAGAGYDVYALDLAGFGLSDKGWDRDYGHAAQAERVIGFMDAIGIERAHIVGHSMGGSVAAHLALSYPDRVDRLVLVAGAVAMESDHTGGRFLPLPPAMLEIPFARRWGQLLMRQFLVPEFESLLYDASFADDTITPQLESGYKRVLYTPGWDLGLMGIIRDGQRQGLPAPVSAIQAPTLLIWGTHDSWVAPANADRLEQAIPDVERVDFKNVGHLPMHEIPAAFNQALIDFLNGSDQG